MTATDDDDLAFLTAIADQPSDEETRLVYADWLEEQGDPRADFIRLHMALATLSPDDARRVRAEAELSVLRMNADDAWLDVIEPERAKRSCAACGDDERELALHTDAQDTECDAWKRLLQLIEDAAADGRAVFAPLTDLGRDDAARIVTLPRSIAKLTSVTRLTLYGSSLVRIPPEIGAMTSLSQFDPYTSYKLHWYPYEITRCANLRNSTVSTRALYGNFKLRTPFPRLEPRPSIARSWSPLEHSMLRSCSVCGSSFEDKQLHRVWISLRVATDVLPLLVNACSEECIARLPPGADNHVPHPHRGGPELVQPAPDW